MYWTSLKTIKTSPIWPYQKLAFSRYAAFMFQTRLQLILKMPIKPFLGLANGFDALVLPVALIQPPLAHYRPSLRNMKT